MDRFSWMLACVLFRPVFKTFARIKVSGLDNLGLVKKPLVIIANHVSYLDPLVIGVTIPLRSSILPVRFLTRKEIYLPGISPFLKATGAIMLDTEKPLKGLKTALSVLKESGTIGIFPEGTRSLDGNLLKFKEGIDFLARKGQATVLPISILGTFKTGEGILNGVKKAVAFITGRYRIRVVIGHPIENDVEENYRRFYYSTLLSQDNLDLGPQHILQGRQHLE